MKTFSEWLIVHEVSQQFDRRGYNALFQQELRRLIREHPTEESKLSHLLNFDWVGYVAKSLRNSGYKDHDIDPFVHEIVVGLLVHPGGLFRNWDHQPIDARFKVAVRNSIINLVQKQRTRQRRIPAVSIDLEFENGKSAQDQLAGRSVTPLDDEAIEAFRELVRKRMGNTALAILDHKLQGGDLRSVIGNENFGKPSSYRIKSFVQEVKKLAEEFARERGDEGFLRQVQRAMAGSEEVVQRRVMGNKMRGEKVG